MITFGPVDLKTFLPESLRTGRLPQDFIPALAKDEIMLKQIETTIKSLPSQHKLFNEDSTAFNKLSKNSVHLVITSPPYWTLKRYNESTGQLGHVEDYDRFIECLDAVWKMCFDALVPGGRLICVVGDVCLSRRKNAGEHVVVPRTRRSRNTPGTSVSAICRRSSGTRFPTRNTRLRAIAGSSASPTSPTGSSRTISNSFSWNENRAATGARPWPSAYSASFPTSCTNSGSSRSGRGSRARRPGIIRPRTPRI
ncbi:MAG: hypothetical protein JXD23_05700 [Spirochaetales bacterium]|nr:hypothetical protein [Spirochaetales bacterium]